MKLHNIHTRTFTFKDYDKNNLEHLRLIKIISEDELSTKFFNEWKELMFSDSDIEYGYIVEKDNIPIGLITICEIDDRNIVFSHIIAPAYRGNRYSSLLKKELYQYLFENNMVDNIICYIDKDNKNNISSMLKSNPDDIKSVTEDLYMVTYKNKMFIKKEDSNGINR